MDPAEPKRRMKPTKLERMMDPVNFVNKNLQNIEHFEFQLALCELKCQPTIGHQLITVTWAHHAVDIEETMKVPLRLVASFYLFDSTCLGAWKLQCLKDAGELKQTQKDGDYQSVGQSWNFKPEEQAYTITDYSGYGLSLTTRINRPQIEKMVNLLYEQATESYPSSASWGKLIGSEVKGRRQARNAQRREAKRGKRAVRQQERAARQQERANHRNRRAVDSE